MAATKKASAWVASSIPPDQAAAIAAIEDAAALLADLGKAARDRIGTLASMVAAKRAEKAALEAAHDKAKAALIKRLTEAHAAEAEAKRKAHREATTRREELLDRLHRVRTEVA